MLRLGLAPASFWALTVAEWRWLLEATAFAEGDADAAMTAETLHALISTYPDKAHD